jgi:Ca2+-binding RTX toxin-like protein
MTIADRFKNGDISRSELKAMAEKDPSLAPQVASLLDEELTESELSGIAAAGIQGKKDQLLEGTAGSEDLFGGDGDDDMDGHSGNDYMEGRGGDDVMEGGRGSDWLEGGEGDDNLDGGRGSDYLLGGEGNDSMDGGRGQDILSGGEGNDTLTGGEDEDYFIFREGDGDDVITDFQPGTDVIYIDTQSADGYEVSYDEETGNSTITYAGGTITVEGVQITGEDINYESFSSEGGEVEGGIGNDVLYGNDGDDTLTGETGDDALKGGDGDDALDGGAGDDYLSGGEGSDTLTGGEGRDTFSFNKDSGDDVITDFTPGEDKIDLRGYGIDGTEYEISYDEETGNSTITHAGGTITIEGVQITGEDVSMRAYGTSGDDNMSGGVGDDSVIGGAGADTISTGAGNDIIDGSVWEDGGADDVAYGGTGNDMYIWTPSGHGSDTFDGGEGYDRLTLDLGDTSVHDAFNNGDIQISLTDADGNPVEITDSMWGYNGSLSLPEGVSGTITGPDGDVMTFTNVESIEGTADNSSSYYPDSPDNDDSSEVFQGTSGDDTMRGGSSDDNIEGSRGNDVIDGGAGDDDIEGGWDNDTLGGGAGDDDMDGGRGDDTLLGGSGEDYLRGGQGDDVLQGGTGHDTMTGGQGDDTFVYRAGDGDDVITDFTPGEDTILIGGNDTDGYEISYDPQTGNSTITYAGGTITVEGVQVTADDIQFQGWATNNDDDVRGGEADDTLLAGGGDDTVTGGAGEDAIAGGSGNDDIDGGAGNDYIEGGRGDDTITGGAGNDMFVYYEGDGDDVITDFTPGEDTIRLVGVDEDGYRVVYDPQTGNSTITYAGGTITVEGAQVTGHDITLLAAGSEADDTIGGGFGDDEISGNAGDDQLSGGAGDDNLFGGDGSDTISGGEDDDYIDGGYQDDAADLISGGAGDDIYVWTPSGDGSDTFDGGLGGDMLLLDMNPGVSVHDAVNNGDIRIDLVDGDGNPVEITAAMWDTNGSLNLPVGVTGTVTGPDGDVLSFQNLERIGVYSY